MARDTGLFLIFGKSSRYSQFNPLHVMMKKLRLPLLLLLLAAGFTTHAQGDLLITPTRVVFEGSKQKEELNLVNVGSDTAIYTVSFVQYNMKEDGGFTQIEKPDSGQMFADPYLRIFPRRITLAPREPQVIMLQYRKKTDMKEGEYRSHLYFRADKESKPLGLGETDEDTTSLKVQLIPIFGLSIPVILRIGNTSVKATLSDLSLEMQQDTIPILKFFINRSGNSSIYGDFRVEHIPAKGQPYEVGVLRGVGVYTNLNRRSVSVRLTKSPGVPLSGGKIRLTYSSNDPMKPVTLFAEQEMELK